MFKKRAQSAIPTTEATGQTLDNASETNQRNDPNNIPRRSSTIKSLTKKLQNVSFRRSGLPKDDANGKTKSESSSRSSGIVVPLSEEPKDIVEETEDEHILEGKGTIPPLSAGKLDDAENLKAINTRLREKIVALEEKLSTKECLIIDMESKFEKAMLQIQSLNETIEKDKALRAQNEPLNSKLIYLEEAKAKLQKRLDEANNELKISKKQKKESAAVNEMELAIQTMQDSKNVIENEVNRATRASLQIQSERNQIMTNILDQSKDLSNSATKLAESEKIFNELKKEKEELKKEQIQLEEKVLNLSSERTTLLQTIKTLEKEVAVHQKNANDFEVENRTLAQKMEASSKALSDLKQNAKDMEFQNSEVKAAIGMVSAENNRLKVKVSDLELKLDNSEKAAQQNQDRLQKELSEMKNIQFKALTSQTSDTDSREISLIQEKSILEYTLKGLKAKSALKQKELESSVTNLTELLIANGTKLADCQAKIDQLLSVNHELELKVCHLNGYDKLSEDQLISLLAVVESRLNSSMIDVFIGRENLESITNDRDQKAKQVEDSKRKIQEMQEANSQLAVDLRSVKDELYSCKENYQSEIEKLKDEINKLGGTISMLDLSSSNMDIQKDTTISLMNSRDSIFTNDDFVRMQIHEENLAVPKDISNGDLIQLSLTAITIFKKFTQRYQINEYEINQILGKFWDDFKVLNDALSERSNLQSTASLDSVMTGDIKKVVNENSMANIVPENSILSLNEPSFTQMVPENSSISSGNTREKESLIKLERELSTVLIVLNERDELIRQQESALKELNAKLVETQEAKELTEEIERLRGEIAEKDKALKELNYEKNTLADRNFLLMSKSTICTAESSMISEEISHQIGELEVQQNKKAQEYKNLIHDLKEEISTLETRLAEQSMIIDKKQHIEESIKKPIDSENQSIEKTSESKSLTATQQELESMSTEEFSWSTSAVYLDFVYAILQKPLDKKVVADKRHLHYYHLCYTMTTIAMISISLPLTVSISMDAELPMIWKQFIQCFACLLAYLIVRRPRE